MSEKAKGPGKQSYTIALGLRSGHRLPHSALRYYRRDGTKSQAPTKKPTYEAKYFGGRAYISQLTFTDQEQVIVTEACRAFAAETADLVNAHAVCTNAWNLFTFINV